jgi:hypothetical protein
MLADFAAMEPSALHDHRPPGAIMADRRAPAITARLAQVSRFSRTAFCDSVIEKHKSAAMR